MKSLFKFSICISALFLASSAFAQTPSRTAPTTTPSSTSTVKQDTIKGNGSRTAPAAGTGATSGSGTSKDTPAPGSNGSRGDEAPSGGTQKMAINEQGVPTKTIVKPKAAAVQGGGSETPAATPANKEGDKKKSEK